MVSMTRLPRPNSATRLRPASALILGLMMFFISVPEALAEDPFSDFFGGLFGGSSHSGEHRSTSTPRIRRVNPRQEKRPVQPKNADQTPSGEPAIDPSVANTPKTYFVAVMGDTMGVLLAKGLQQVLSEKPEIGILNFSKENSGLTRSDFYDWPKSAHDIASGAQKIDVAVILLGSNDRQSFQGADGASPLTAQWRDLYSAKINAVTSAFKDKKIPVIWVGLPVMKNEAFSADMAKFNEIYKERAIANGAIYVDLWDALSDEKNQFSAFGPDINGQIVKTRAADGVNFTPAGAAIVAHFVANEIKKIYQAHPPSPQPLSGATPPEASANNAPNNATLSNSGSPSQAPSAPVEFHSPVAPVANAAPSLPERPAIGPIQSLNSYVDAPGELAKKSADAGSSTSEDPARALARHVFVQGGDQPARKNRADDDSWKP